MAKHRKQEDVQEIVPLYSSAPQLSSLSVPVRALARPTLSVEVEDSLALAANRTILNGTNFLPVTHDGRLVGIITGADLARAIGEAVETSDAVANYLSPAKTLPSYATGAQALRALEGGEPLLIIDDANRLVGLLSAADLFPRHRPPLKPAAVGGMATPFGVFLTTGNEGAGVAWYGIASAGAYLTLMLAGSLLGARLLVGWLAESHLDLAVCATLEVVFAAVFFKILFRVLPLSGIHGAEHQVVHAIERELELTPTIVSRMPRVHPRCGTNYSVAALLFCGSFNVSWTPFAELRLFAAVAVTGLLWRPLGRLVQLFVTTKPPNEKQLGQAIAAGQELLRKYAGVRTTYPNLPQRVWKSGLPLVLGAAIATGILLSTISYVTGFQLL